MQSTSFAPATGFDLSVPRRALGAIGVAALLALTGASAAHAKTLFVATSGSDANPCTQTAPCAHISHALGVAGSGDTIAVGPGTFDENVTDSEGPSPITIQGAGANATTVYGGLAGNVFEFGDVTALLSNLGIGGGSSSVGGGVYAGVASNVTLDDDIVAFNSAHAGGGVGAIDATLRVDHTAIYANQAAGGNVVDSLGGGGIVALSATATIVDSAIYQNTLSAGPAEGAGVSAGDSVVHLANDTIGENTSPGVGGGVAFITNTTGSLDGDTIADNQASGGGGVATLSPTGSGSASVSDTIIAANQGGNCDRAGFTSTSHDLEDDAAGSCGFAAASHDRVGVDPRLGPLAANGGPTQTMALAAGSPAVSAGSCASVDAVVGADVDQRGQPRDFAERGVCDIGAWDSGGSLTGVAVRPQGALEATRSLPYRLALQASGGTGIYTWSLASGLLPAGLSLSANGLIAGTPSTAGSSRFTVEVTDTAIPTPHISRQSLSMTVYPPPQPAVWVANGANSDLNAFALNANGDVAPVSTLVGSLTQLNGPDGLAFDSVGDLYVADADTPAITVYQAGASGDAPPVRRIAGSATGLFSPAGVALDGAGNLYVADDAAQTVTVYAPGANGNAAPIRKISGGKTGLSQPWGVAVDAAGNLWIANYGSGALTEYPPRARGDVAPINTVAGGSTGLAQPFGLGQDASGHLLVADYGGSALEEFPDAGSFGNVAPSFMIPGGSASQMYGPRAVDVDALGRLYVANAAGVTVFAPGSTTPAAVIAAGQTSGIAGADAVALAPPLAITTARLPTAALGRRYAERIGAVLGRAPLRWRLRRGRLPRGLRLTRSGVVRGVPLQVGVFHFTVRVRDSTRPAMSDRRRITLVVRRAPSITEVRPHSGRARGGRRVTILGSGFALGRGTTTITFARLNAIGVVCRTHTRCTARTPPDLAGTVRVSVTVDGLTAHGSRGTRYRYR